MALWIAQCLCPSRHCIVAATGEVETEAEAEREVRQPLRRDVVGMLASGAINPWCAICNANRATWRYEVRRTRFATMAEAAPELARLQAGNLAMNLLWGDIHKTSRPN
jgi:hypothetical protein